MNKTHKRLGRFFGAALVATVVAAPSVWACGSGEQLIGSICVATYQRGCPSGYVKADGSLLSINTNQALYSLIGTVFGGDGRTTFGIPNLSGRVPVGMGPATQISGQSPTSAVALGQYRGAESVALTPNQVPLHTHPANFTAITGPQQVTIPAQAGSGAITATATTDIVPGSAGIDPLPNVSTYYLTGVTTGAAGPVTTTVPGGDKSTLIGTKVSVSTTGYKPALDAQTVTISTVTGGTVAVGYNTTSGAAVATLPPQVGVVYCIATQGTYPSFP